MLVETTACQSWRVFWDTVYNSSATASAVYPKSFTTMAATFYPNVANKYTCCKQRSLSPEPGNSTVDDILRNVLEDNPVEISPPQITPLRYPPPQITGQVGEGQEYWLVPVFKFTIGGNNISGDISREVGNL